MLKWTVTKRSENNPLGGRQQQQQQQQRRPYHARRSLGVIQTNTANSQGTPTSSRPAVRGRRSLASISVHQELNKDKENRYTSTPCVPPNAQQVSRGDDSLTSQLALRDVSNITTPTTSNNNNNNINNHNTAKKRANCFTNTPVLTSTMRKRTAQTYSTTLPTFDVEYSPCDKPFGEFHEFIHHDVVVVPPSAKKQKIVDEFNNFKKPNLDVVVVGRNNNNLITPDDSLHSSQMGDVTLDKMIDAILESARKERPKRSASVKSKESQIMSPTYTPADDPASDLDPVIDLSPEKYCADKTIILQEHHNEREVRTPDSPKFKRKRSSPESCHLRRQRAVRRKQNKNEKLMKNHHHNNHQSPVTPKYEMEETYLRKTLDELAQIETPKNTNHLVLDMMLDTSSQFYPSATSQHTTTTTHNQSTSDEKFLLLMSDCDSKMSDNETTPEHHQLMNCWNTTSTPTEGANREANIIRKCLTFSPPGTSEESIEKRRSVASSISRYSRTTFANGTIDVAIHVNSNKLFIHGEWYMVMIVKIPSKTEWLEFF